MHTFLNIHIDAPLINFLTFIQIVKRLYTLVVEDLMTKMRMRQSLLPWQLDAYVFNFLRHSPTHNYLNSTGLCHYLAC